MSRSKRIAFATGLFVGLSLGMIGGSAVSHADPINEDDPGFSCVDDGNRICGPGNDQGAPAGLYDEGGVLIAPWPTTLSCEAFVGLPNCVPVYAAPGTFSFHVGSGDQPGPVA